MAPSIAVTVPNHVEYRGGKERGNTVEKALRKRNEELELEMRRREEREEKMRIELERMKRRLSTVEEAEERLCSELGDLEAESLAQAREYQDQIRDLMSDLEQVKRLLILSGKSFPPRSIQRSL